MADHYIGVNRGAMSGKPVDITRGTSTSSNDVELRYGDALALTRLDVIKACRLFIRLLSAGGSAPSGQNFPTK